MSRLSAPIPRQRRFRALLRCCARRIPVRRGLLGLATGLVETARECADDPSAGMDFRQCSPAFVLERRFLGGLPDGLHPKLRDKLTVQMPARFVAELRGGLLWGEHGSVFTADGRLVWELSREFGKQPREHSIFSRRRGLRWRRLPGRTLSLASFCGDRYYHWMLDVLPRLELLRRETNDWRDIDWFVLNPLKFPYQGETLRRLGIPLEKVIEGGSRTVWEAEHLIVPALNGRVGNTTVEGCRYVRGLFGDEISSRGSGGGRIYISRSDASYRRLLNEPELIAALERRRFKSVELARLTVAEQASLFSRAEAVVAPHGAGLTNLLFSPAGQRVVELFSPVYVNACFFALSSIMDLSYSCLVADSSGEEAGVVEANMVVEVAKVEAILDERGIV